jgi:hypothetical protein
MCPVDLLPKKIVLRGKIAPDWILKAAISKSYVISEWPDPHPE